MNSTAVLRPAPSIRLFAAAGLALLLSGCNAVYVSSPIGDKPHAFDPAAVEGAWLVDHDVAKVKVANAAQGELRVVMFGEENGQPKLTTLTIYVRESGNRLFASMRDEDKADCYLWALIELNDDQLIVWSPDVRKFRDLVRDQKLPGSLDGDDVVLGPLSRADLQRLTSGDLGVLLQWECPLIYRRVAR